MLPTCAAVKVLVVNDDAVTHTGVAEAVAEALGLGLGVHLHAL